MPRGGHRPGAGRKRKKRTSTVLTKSAAERVYGQIDAEAYWLALFPPLKDGRLDHVDASERRFVADLLEKLENRIFGRPAQAVISFDPDNDNELDPVDIASRRDKVRKIIAGLNRTA